MTFIGGNKAKCRFGQFVDGRQGFPCVCADGIHPVNRFWIGVSIEAKNTFEQYRAVWFGYTELGANKRANRTIGRMFVVWRFGNTIGFKVCLRPIALKSFEICAAILSHIGFFS